MIIRRDPEKCSCCGSRNIYLMGPCYSKGRDGEYTDMAISGVWMCGDCANPLGRKLSQFENDIDEDSFLTERDEK